MAEYQNNEIMVAGAMAPRNVFEDEGFALDVDLTTAKTQFCSMKAETLEEKAQLFNAMNNPAERISDHINEVIMAKDLYVEIVNCTNQETGEVTACPRIVLIDENGIGFQAVSLGIYSAMKKVVQVFGAPTWSTPVPLKVTQISKGTRKMLTLSVVSK